MAQTDKEKNADYVIILVKQFLKSGTGRSLSTGSRIMRRIAMAVALYEKDVDPKVAELSNEIANIEVRLIKMLKQREDLVKEAIETGRWNKD